MWTDNSYDGSINAVLATLKNLQVNKQMCCNIYERKLCFLMKIMFF
jgi:hypothetical protein